MGQAPRIFQGMIVPLRQLRHSMAREEFGPRWLAGQFPNGRFRAVLAEFERVGMGRLGAGAAWAGKAGGLVLPRNHEAGVDQIALVTEMTPQRTDRSPAAGRAVVCLE